MFRTTVKCGRHFGNLTKIYGEYRFALAPNEQSAWKNFFRDAIWKVQYWVAIPLFATFYPLTKWAKKTNEKHYRKNPADFANDE
uniref:Cytochrome b-c1 complex subunit 8 n=1 Tax=Syphacia muris TaxID=451379 RepID=A0A0N5ANE9_9BILA